ncbi:19443_t:CDS:2 [Entrophospora sp. SA101]|nr:19443_t:CDS:2 [Entrophospora sp. SA101]
MKIFSKLDLIFLKKLVEKHGQDWNKISGIIKNKTPLECLKKYQELLPNKFEPIIAKSEQRTALSKIPDEGIIIPGWTKQEFELVNELWPIEAIKAFNIIREKCGRWELIPLLLPGFSPLLCFSPYTTIPHRWTKSDKILLKNLISKYGFDWYKIIPFFPHRNSAEVQQYVAKNISLFQDNDDGGNKLKKKISKDKGSGKYSTRWKIDKIIKLFELRNLGKSWKDISKVMKDRTPSGCYLKYYSVLKIYSELELSKKWDVMDVIKFQKYYYKYNRNWELISEQMGNKSVKQIKDFFTNNKNRFPNFITSKSLKKKEWSEEEIIKLVGLLKEFGTNWKLISKHFEKKSKIECIEFYNSNHDSLPQITNTNDIVASTSEKWTKKDDNMLKSLLEEHGTDYDKIASYFIVTTTIWSDYDENRLIDLINLYGNNWEKISTIFGDRSPNACSENYNHCDVVGVGVAVLVISEVTLSVVVVEDTIEFLANNISNDPITLNISFCTSNSFLTFAFKDFDKNTTALVKHSWPIEAIKAFNIIREKCGRWELIPLLLPGFSPLLCFSPYTTIPHRWTKSDKILLKNLISKYGFDWYKIIPFFPHRNSAEVQQYVAKNISLFQDNDDGGNKLKKKISKDKGSGKYSTRWKIDKIIKLFELRNLGKSWKDISKVMKDRTPSGCYLKYYSVLKIYSELELSKKWDVMDVIKFQKYYYKYNRNWELISEQMGNKSVKQIKDFFTNNKNRFPNFITSKSLKKKEWSEEEIIKLVGLLKEFGTNWKLISKHFEKKSKIECIEFYNSNHDSLPQITNTNDIVASTSEKWTKKDDNMLKSLLEEHGTDYDKIASYFIVTTTIWSDYDENRLIDLINLYGNNWEKISTIFGDRSPNACSEKYHSIVNPMIERTEIYQ